MAHIYIPETLKQIHKKCNIYNLTENISLKGTFFSKTIKNGPLQAKIGNYR